MSVSSGMQVSKDLARTLEELRKPTSPVQVLKVQIQDETLIEVKSQNGSPTKDLKVIAPLAEEDAAAYFLLRLTPAKWACVIYVPEKVSKVKERMIYASSHQSLIAAMGKEFIVEDIHIASKEEISGKAIESNSRSDDLLSKSEKNVREAINQENIARKEQEVKQGEIGGYHSVSLDFPQDASSALENFKTGSVNWIELAIGSNQKSIELKKSKNIATHELPQHVEKVEPRFYIYKVGIKAVFIYCCPSKSQTKSRMVYSTAKPSVLENVTKLGIEIEKKLEFSEADDLNHANILEEMKNQRAVYQNSSPTSSKHMVELGDGAHPVYGMMKEGKEGTSTTQRSEFEAGVIKVGNKKIVLPPSVAYH